MAAAGVSPGAAPLFSIVVPVLDEQAAIETCLTHLGGLREIGRAEVIVADGGGGSTLRAMRAGPRPYRLRTLVCPRGRGRQQNAGASASAGQLLIFLHVDTLLPPRALVLVRRALLRHPAGAFSFATPHPRGFFRLWLKFINWRVRLTGTPYGDQAIFLRAEEFRRLGGFRDLPLMEDVDLVRRLRRRGLRPRILAARVVTSDRRWRRGGYLANLLRNTALFLLYRVGLAPAVLARAYPPCPDPIVEGRTKR